MSAVEGLLNIDKPGGLTSHDVVDKIRQLAGIRRVGHAGTLDPLATGVLLLCLGRATRLLEYLVGQDKVYDATIRLGQATDTYDAEGTVTEERPVPELTEASLHAALLPFTGAIEQRPPAYSAVKKDGQPLYKLARKGELVERPLRDVAVHELTLLSWEPPYLRLQIACSSGTYVRSLAHDLGRSLGCGGHISHLRRLASGAFTLDEATPLAALSSDNLIDHIRPADTAVAHLARVDVSDREAHRLSNGQSIARRPTDTEVSPVRAYTRAGRFLGILVTGDGSWRPRKMFPTES